MGIRKGELFFLVLCMFYITGLYFVLNSYSGHAEASTLSHTWQEPSLAEEEKEQMKEEPKQEEIKPVVRLRPSGVNHTSNSLLEVLNYQIVQNNQLVNQYKIGETIEINPTEYATLPGVTCFRGNATRSAPSYGYANIKTAQLEILWSNPIGGLGEWTGVGWNGQPAIVRWADQWKQKMNLSEPKKQKRDLKEVIFATLDGNVYFLDMENGEATRPVIKIPGPVKGSLTVDPRGLPLLYVGQGIDSVQGRRVEMGYRIFSLLNQERLFFIPGYDKFAYRGWGAFDSTSLVDGKTDTLLECGENGLFYRIKLNSWYDEGKNKINLAPEVTKYRYQVSGKGNHQGIENSVVIYKNRAYFADNGGVLQCVDLNTMKPLWARNVTDDTDSTCVLEEEDPQNVFLYTACEVDKQGAGGYSYIRKYDALTGEPQWEKSYKCFLNSHTNGGALATPVLGKGELANLVIFNLARSGSAGGGHLVALDKYSGEEVWKQSLPNYCWSSPVDVYTRSGEGYLIVCDSIGRMYLMQGKTGQILHSISLGANVEGSPAVYDNTIVVGTRGQKIFGVRIN